MRKITSKKAWILPEITVVILFVMTLAWFIFPSCSVEEPQPELMIPNFEEVLQNVDMDMVDRVLQEKDLSHLMAAGRECKGDGRASKNTTIDTFDYGTFYLLAHRNRGGKWQNPSDDFAMTYYDAVTNEPFYWKSYNNQVSTDVVSNKVRYPSSIKLMSDGTIRIIHKQNRYETDITYKQKGKNYTIPAVIFLDAATQDTVCTGSYDCGKFISGCNWY